MNPARPRRARAASVPSLREMLALDNERRSLSRQAASLKTAAALAWTARNPEAADAFAILADRLDSERRRL